MTLFYFYVRVKSLRIVFIKAVLDKLNKHPAVLIKSSGLTLGCGKETKGTMVPQHIQTRNIYESLFIFALLGNAVLKPNKKKSHSFFILQQWNWEKAS